MTQKQIFFIILKFILSSVIYVILYDLLLYIKKREKATVQKRTNFAEFKKQVLFYHLHPCNLLSFLFHFIGTEMSF